MKCKRITDGKSNDQLLYFTSTSVVADDSALVFLSDRTGHPNIFYRDLESGEERQLTSNKEGYLKSYVYFDGSVDRGLGKASISLDPYQGKIYYLQGREIRCVDVQGNERTLGETPSGQVTAFTHVSSDGTKLCIPTSDARALEGYPGYNIDQRVQAEGLNSYLRVYDTQSGNEILTERVPKAWITHVQFNPLDTNVILYNHEWPSQCGIRRMWIWDGTRHIRLRTEAEGRQADDWACHEFWLATGSALIYHGGYKEGPCYVGRVLPDGTELCEISLPPGYTKYGHFTISQAGLLVSDGYYQEDNEPLTGRAEWISLQQVDWEQRTIQWIPLCKHGSSWSSQDAHPHPIFNHSGTSVFYTSDQDGVRAIYKIDLVSLGV